MKTVVIFAATRRDALTLASDLAGEVPINLADRVETVGTTPPFRFSDDHLIGCIITSYWAHSVPTRQVQQLRDFLAEQGLVDEVFHPTRDLTIFTLLGLRDA